MRGAVVTSRRRSLALAACLALSSLTCTPSEDAPLPPVHQAATPKPLDRGEALPNREARRCPGRTVDEKVANQLVGFLAASDKHSAQFAFDSLRLLAPEVRSVLVCELRNDTAIQVDELLWLN